MIVCLFHSAQAYRERALIYRYANERKIKILVFYHNLDKQCLNTYPDTDYLTSKQLNQSVFDFSLVKAILETKFDNKGYPTFIWIAGWNSLHNIQAIFLCIILRLRYMLWTDTINVSVSRNSFLKIFRSIFLHYIIKHSYRVGTTGKPGINAFASQNYFKCDSIKFIDFPLYNDLDRYRRKNFNSMFSNSLAQNHKLKILCVGWLIDARKGQSVILNALQKFSANYAFQMTFVGTGPDRDSLIKLSHQLGLRDYVSFVGQKTSDELIEYYINSDLLIHSPTLHEPYGVVVQEAMAAGVVVLASDKTCAALDVIENGQNGFIHEAGNAEMICDQLISIMNDKNNFNSIREKSYKTSKKWDLNLGIQQLDSLIEDN